MNYPVACDACGSTHLRRSRQQSAAEALKTTVGIYSFRCLDCNNRFPVNVLLLSRLAFAKCPKCLGQELTTWALNRYHIPLLKKLMLTFGARRYRCSGCRCNFVSFRPALRDASRALRQKAGADEVVFHDEDSAQPRIS